MRKEVAVSDDDTASHQMEADVDEVMTVGEQDVGGARHETVQPVLLLTAAYLTSLSTTITHTGGGKTPRSQWPFYLYLTLLCSLTLTSALLQGEHKSCRGENHCSQSLFLTEGSH